VAAVCERAGVDRQLLLDRATELLQRRAALDGDPLVEQEVG